MSLPVFVKHLDHFIPEYKLFFKDHLDFFSSKENDTVFTNGEEFLEFADEFLDIKSINVANGESLEEMLTALVERNIEDENKINISRTKYIIVASDFEHQLKHFGHFLQHHLEMKHTNVLRITDNYCANVDMAIGLATELLRNEKDEAEVLILTGSRRGSGLEKRIVGSYGVMGDSVGIMVLTNCKENGQVEVKGQGVTTKGEFSTIDFSKDSTILHYQSYVESIKKVFDKCEIGGTEVKQVILHNANQMLIEHAISACEIDKELVYKSNLKKYGHLGTTDLILNMKSYLEENKAGGNENILSVSNGVVGTYVSTLFAT